MKTGVIAVAALTLAAQAWATDSPGQTSNPGQSSIQIRLTEPKPNKYTDRMEFIHQDDPSDGIKELVFVDRTTVADQSEIKSAQAINYGDGQARVDLYLTGVADAPLRHNAGRHIAVLIGGQVWGVGRLAPESTTAKLEISGAFTPDQARALADKINQAER
jgi:preprotein translocase subunit SecD